MSLMKNRITQEKDNKIQIEQKVLNENFRPTEEEEKYSKQIIHKLSDKFSDVLDKIEVESNEEVIRASIREFCEELDIPFEMKRRIEKNVVMTALGHGPIEVFLQDPDVTEIIVQRFDNITIEKNGKIIDVDVTFNNEEHLQNIIKRIVQRVGRQINLTTPIVDARLEDGSRVNATIPPVSPDGATLTIRKFNNSVLTGRDYLNYGSISRPMLYFLERCVKAKISIFVSGGTGTGKTTLLNMLSSFVPDDELILTIEDSCELKLHQKNLRRMETRVSTIPGMMQVTTKELVKNALRQRPDRIIVGEIRDGSIVDMLSAMSTGHEGSMSTGHANSPENLVNVRMPLMFSMNEDASFSERSQALQISEAIQLIVQISRFPDGSRKITNISHICGVDDRDKVIIKDIFIYDREDKQFKFTGYVPEEIVTTFRNKEINFNQKIFRKEESS